MMEFRRVAITIALTLVTTVSAVCSQDAGLSREPHVRPLSSFESVYVPDISDRGSTPASGPQPWRLTRELRERLTMWYRMPFYWTLVDSIGSTTADTIVATAKPDPTRRSGIVIEFADMEGKSIAALHSATISAAIRLLDELTQRTTLYPGVGHSRASRPVGSYPLMHLSFNGNDEFNLLARVMSAFRQRGPWSLVDSMPAEGNPQRAQTVQCFIGAGRGVPTHVSLGCGVPLVEGTAGAVFDPRRAELVLYVVGSSCKGCLGTVAFSSVRTRAIPATDDLVRDVLEHLELEQTIYSPQRGDRSR